MITKFHYLEAPRRLRAFVRAHETSLVVLAALVGALGGLVVVAMSAAVEALHVVLFNLEAGERLSSQVKIDPLRALLVPSLGGLLLGVAFLLLVQHVHYSLDVLGGFVFAWLSYQIAIRWILR